MNSFNAKRILLVGSSAEHALEQHYSRAFREMGLEVDLFDFERSVRWAHRPLVYRLAHRFLHVPAGRALVRWLSRSPRYDAVVVFKGLLFSASALRACRAIGPETRWVNINPDSPFDRGRATSDRHVRATLRLYDTYFIWSRKLVDELAAVGCRRPVYLPFGYDPAAHFPARERDPSLGSTVTFVGTYDERRAAILEAIADEPVRIFGGRWERLRAGSRLRSKITPGAVYGDALRRVVTSSLASINLLRRQNEGAHNMRTFEVPAMGGLLLTTRSSEQQEWFPEGDASLMFGDGAELRLRVQELVAGRHDTGALRRSSLERVKEHSYLARARAIADCITQL